MPSVPSDFRFSELENFDLVNWDPSVPRRPVYVRESELLSRALSIPYVLEKGGSQEGLIATIINCQSRRPKPMDSESARFESKKKQKKTLCPPLNFLKLLVCLAHPWRAREGFRFVAGIAGKKKHDAGTPSANVERERAGGQGARGDGAGQRAVFGGEIHRPGDSADRGGERCEGEKLHAKRKAKGAADRWRRGAFAGGPWAVGGCACGARGGEAS